MTPAGGTLTALVGLLTLRLTVDGTYARYVRLGMKPWLFVAGVALLVLGLVALALALRARGNDDDEGSPESPEVAESAESDGLRAELGHEHGVGVGWLLLAPMAVLLLVAPPSLGSFSVNRGSPIQITAGKSVLPPLDTSKGPIPMTLLEYGERAYDHDGTSMSGATVVLTGFVSADDGSGEFDLARFQIACCAADAEAAVVHVVGAATVPARDQWVTVTGTYTQGGGDTPYVAASSLQEITAPEDPYE